MKVAGAALSRGSARGWRTLLLAAAVVVGLIVLHQLGGPLGVPGHRHAGDSTAHGGHTAVTAGHDGHAAAPAGHDGHASAAAGRGAHAVPASVPCSHPADRPGHPHGQACQAKPGTSPALTPPRTAIAYAATTVPAVAVTPSTGDHDAAGGSGCGPPGRALLSVWRI